MTNFEKNIVVNSRSVQIHFFRKIAFRCNHNRKIEFVVVGYVDGLVIILDEAGLQYGLKCESAITGISFACCGQEHKIAVSITALDKLYVYDYNNGFFDKEPTTIFDSHEGRALDVAWVRENNEDILITCDERGNIYRRKGNILKNNISTSIFRAHRKAALRLLPFIYKDKSVFLTFSDDRNVLIHNVYSDEIIQSYDLNNGWVDNVFLLENNGQVNTICISDRVGILLWDICERKFLFRFPFFVTTNFSHWRLDDTIEYIVVGSQDKYLLLKKTVDKVEPFIYSNKYNIRAISFLQENNINNKTPSILLGFENKIYLQGVDELLNNEILITESFISKFDSPILTMFEWSRKNGYLILLEDGNVYSLFL
jgi:WD40 repeat protein